MLLGEIMTRLQDETRAAEAVLELGDIVLLAEIDCVRQAHDESIGAYVSGAAGRFASLASDDDWLRLMTALERSERPAASCLQTMVRWSIARDREAPGCGAAAGCCSCGGGGTDGHVRT